MDTSTVGLIGAAIGGIITGVPAVITFWLGKRSEEKRHLQQLVMQAAIENWKYQCEAAIRLKGVAQPIDAYIIHALKLVQIIERNDLDEQTVRQHMRELSRIVKAVEEEIEKHEEQADAATPHQPP